MFRKWGPVTAGYTYDLSFSFTNLADIADLADLVDLADLADPCMYNLSSIPRIIICKRIYLHDLTVWMCLRGRESTYSLFIFLSFPLISEKLAKTRRSEKVEEEKNCCCLSRVSLRHHCSRERAQTLGRQILSLQVAR